MQSVPDNSIKPDIDRIMSEYLNQILRICYLYLKDYSLAEDAAQDTFIKVYNKYYLYENKSSEKTWITRIAINICNDYLRTAWLRKTVTGIGIKEAHECNAESKTIESQVFAKETNRELLIAISNLKPIFKEVIILHYYQKCSTKEISKVMGIPEGTVCTRLKRARGSLKNLLAKNSYIG